MYRKLSSGYWRSEDAAVIPEHAPGNRDWEALQVWLSDGNVPLDYRFDSVADLSQLRAEENRVESVRRLDVYVAGRSVAETTSWTPKANDARLFQSAGSLDSVPALLAEVTAQLPDSTPEQIEQGVIALANTVLQKEGQMKIAAAIIVGVRTRIQSEINQSGEEGLESISQYKVKDRWKELLP